MAHDVDMVVRNGRIVDGTGAEAFEADIAISGGRIVEVGTLSVRGRDEVDAQGLVVTPGFVDIHTHYDGQVTWADRLIPSSSHGVTTVVMGNCGVGFAPCRPDQHEMLIGLMEGVEDIPHPVLVDGLPWTWETFPQYLDFLATRRYDMDICAYLPHAPVRVYVMGQRGADREPGRRPIWSRWPASCARLWRRVRWAFQHRAHSSTAPPTASPHRASRRPTTS